MIIKKCINLLGLLLCCAVFSVSCSDDNVTGGDSGKEGSTVVPDFTQKVKSSISGFVTNELGEPVLNAVVKCGEGSTSTDENGYFEMNDVSVAKGLGVVTVEAASYFKGIRTWVANADAKEFVRIKLIPKTIKGSFSASQGGEVKLSNGLTLSFPANVVVDEASGEAYNGNVSVAMYWINPMGENFNQEMPGDLSAINEDGYLRNLVSYGMVAAELTGDSNQKLQIAVGKSVSVAAPIEQEQLSSAPQTMPLWLFDEEKGLWIERGEAKKEGDKYVGELDHFSYWNLDIPYTPCTVTIKFVDESNRAIVNQQVFLEGKISNQLYAFYAYTDENGMAEVRSVSNTAATIVLRTGYNCVLYSKDINPQGVSLDLGTVKVPQADMTNKEYVISGTVTNCNGEAIADGLLVYQIEGVSYTTRINDGKYEFSSYFCAAALPITIKAYDYSTMKSVSIKETGITEKNHVVAPITICDNNALADIYVKFEVDGKVYIITDENNSDYYNYFWRLGNNNIYSINAQYADQQLGVSIGFGWLEYTNTAVAGTFPLSSLSVLLSDSDDGYYQWPYNPGEGSGSVTMIKYLQPQEHEYDVKGTFEVKGAKNGMTQKTVDIKGEFAFKGIARPY